MIEIQITFYHPAQNTIPPPPPLKKSARRKGPAGEKLEP